MKIAVAGTGYVGLVTGVAMANIGHNVTCVDVDLEKILLMQKGISPIYEQGLEELMKKNSRRLTYTTDYKNAYKDAEIIFIGVGTPEKADGSANLKYVYNVCDNIAESIEKNCVVVIKSTVPIGTNDNIEKYLRSKIKSNINISVASNPEFLAQGTAVRDTLYASRIVVGIEDDYAKKMMAKVYLPFTKEPYNVPYIFMDRRSAEMVKYASNDFLALKISYINEISNFCELIGANIQDVTKGMSFDSRIGNKFLNSGIGYGGSCFPKDTKALHWLSKEFDSELKTVKACIDVNNSQKIRLFYKILNDYGNINGINIAVLGATFKPETDDLREAPSISIINLLLECNVNVFLYDPVGLENMKKIFNDKIVYCSSIDDAITNKDIAIIVTEWQQIKDYQVEKFVELMKEPVLYDGRNCYSIEKLKSLPIHYVSMGRPVINNYQIKQLNN
ncbi:MAG: UDP-glucose/GDP-mannose dehydrogenase family protein [Bacilli bacterium]